MMVNWFIKAKTSAKCFALCLLNIWVMGILITTGVAGGLALSAAITALLLGITALVHVMDGK